MERDYIVDSSVLVALLSRYDQHHDWARTQAEVLPWPWLSCEAALTEAFYLLGRTGAPSLGEMLRKGALGVAFDLAGELEPVLSLMDKYANLPISLADACLIRMSEKLPEPVVVTTDSDFKIYRRHSRQVIPCLMPT